MNVVDLVIKAANDFYSEMNSKPNERYRSWEYCYQRFHDAREKQSHDYDYLSLNLAFYLASWGMYRGSSFLLQKDYKVHIPIVKELLNPKYDCLLGIKCENLIKDKSAQTRLDELSKAVAEGYNSVRKSVKGTEMQSKISDTLITKVLMGTLGCVPAYDRYFISGVKETGVSTGNYNIQAIMRLAEFYRDNCNYFDKALRKYYIDRLQYPQMKLLDMGFWQIGLKKCSGKLLV